MPEFSASDTSGCAPLTVHFNNASFANDTMGMSYHWIIYDENGNVVLTSDKATPDLQFDYEGQYTVKLVVITDEGCTDSITKYNYLTINYQPLAEFDALPEVSLWSETNGSIFFQVQGDTLEFGDGMGFYWDFGDGSIDSSSYALEHSYSSWGDYDVTLSMFTPDGCNSSITHTITLEADLIFPNVIKDIIVVVGGVIPPQDYDFLYKAGAAAIFGPGSVISDCAIKILEILMN